jgi:hypothetical protein
MSSLSAESRETRELKEEIHGKWFCGRVSMPVYNPRLRVSGGSHSDTTFSGEALIPKPRGLNLLLGVNVPT